MHVPSQSRIAIPPQAPLQSCIQLLLGSVSQILHSSTAASPPHIPIQSCTQSLLESESHILHSSGIAIPSHTPKQSSTAGPLLIPKQSINWITSKETDCSIATCPSNTLIVNPPE